MTTIRDPLKSEALSAANAASRAGLNQNEIALAIGASQSQVSRILSGKSLRRSKTFEKICIYAFESLGKVEAKTRPSAATNHHLITALDAVWDGSDQHAKALALVIHSLGGLNRGKAAIAQSHNAKLASSQKSAP